MSTSSPSSSTLWIPITLASVILMITMGIRQTVGLFVHPIVMETTMSIAEISMALAIGQLMWEPSSRSLAPGRINAGRSAYWFSGPS